MKSQTQKVSPKMEEDGVKMRQHSRREKASKEGPLEFPNRRITESREYVDRMQEILQNGKFSVGVGDWVADYFFLCLLVEGKL